MAQPHPGSPSGLSILIRCPQVPSSLMGTSNSMSDSSAISLFLKSNARVQHAPHMVQGNIDSDSLMVITKLQLLIHSLERLCPCMNINVIPVKPTRKCFRSLMTPLQDVVFAHKIWLKRFLSRVSRSRVMVGRRITTALRRRNKPPE